MSRTLQALMIALVRRAARTAPSSLSARLEEEWLADLQERSPGLARLGFTLGCFWAGMAIGLEQRPLAVPVASGAPGHAPMIGQHPGFLSSRTATIGLVLCLHGAVFYGLMVSGLHTHLFKPPDPPPLQPHMIDRPQPKIDLPAPSVDFRFTDKIRPPLITEVLPEPKPTDVSTSNLAPPPIGPDVLTAPPRAVIHVQGGPGPGFPPPDDYYPDAARRLEEQGTTILIVCVDPAGRLTSDPLTTATSGSRRLDAAAIRLARAGSGHYRPSTDDGRPIASCYPFRIHFQLRN